MLVPVDRSNFSGYWFAAPGTIGFGFPTGSHGSTTGPFGRNDASRSGGRSRRPFKYYAASTILYDVDTRRCTRSVELHCSNPEPGYYNSSTYYGKTVGGRVGLQAKRMDPSPPWMLSDDYSSSTRLCSREL